MFYNSDLQPHCTIYGATTLSIETLDSMKCQYTKSQKVLYVQVVKHVFVVLMTAEKRCHDTQHNDIQHDDTRHNDTKQNI
jgi:hypothetical protein